MIPVSTHTPGDKAVGGNGLTSVIQAQGPGEVQMTDTPGTGHNSEPAGVAFHPAANEGGADEEVEQLNNSKTLRNTQDAEAGEGPPPDDPASAATIPGQCPPIPEILRRTEGAS